MGDFNDEGNEGLPFMYHNYLFKRIIGRGSYSVVYEVESIQYLTTFAAKVTPIDEDQLNENGEFYDPELSALIMLDNPGIIRVYNYFVMNDSLVLILEYCSSGTLYDLIKSDTLQKENLNNILYMITKSLSYCHSNQVSHRDIKPSNIFIDKYGRPKLADFGLSSFVNKKEHFVSDCCGSKVFAAPEIFGSAPYDAYAADIFALGVLFYETATGKLPWKEDQIATHEIKQWQLDLVESPELRRLIKIMTLFDPKKRPTISQVLKSRYLSQRLCLKQRGSCDCLKRASETRLPALNDVNKPLPYYSIGNSVPSQVHTRGKLKSVYSTLFPKRCKVVGIRQSNSTSNMSTL